MIDATRRARRGKRLMALDVVRCERRLAGVLRGFRRGVFFFYGMFISVGCFIGELLVRRVTERWQGLRAR